MFLRWNHRIVTYWRGFRGLLRSRPYSVILGSQHGGDKLVTGVDSPVLVAGSTEHPADMERKAGNGEKCAQFRNPEFDRQKFKNLIVLVADQSASDDYFGLTKLNKLLFFLDFETYAHTGRPITGARYQKNNFGPTPAALMPILEELETDGTVQAVPGRFERQVRLEAIRAFNGEGFTTEELSSLEEIVGRYAGYSATAISKVAYEEYPLDIFENGETIPYEIALVGNGAYTDKDIQIAEELESEAVAWLESRNGS